MQDIADSNVERIPLAGETPQENEKEQLK